MQWQRNLARFGGAVVAGLALWPPAVLVRAGEPGASGSAGRPPWQRLLTGDDARQAETLERQVEQLWTRGEFAEAVPLAEQLRALRSRVQGADHWQAADARRRVETLRLLAGKPANQRREVAALPDQERAADALRAQGRSRDEEPLRQQILTVTRAALGEEHPDTAAAYDNLASCQQHQGRYAEAERGYEHALAIWRTALGDSHPDTATAHNNLALCQHHQGRYAEAQRGLERGLAIRRQALGEEHPDTAQAYDNLAVCHQAQGRYAEAERGFERALAVFRKALGEEHPDTAQAYNNVACCQLNQGHHAEAERGFERALGLWRKALGEEHPLTSQAYFNLAGCRLAQGRLTEAERDFERALALWRKALGEGHPDTALAHHNLALCLQYQGRNAEAERGFERALVIWRKVIGAGHPDTAEAYRNLAHCQHAQGRYGPAEQSLTQAAKAFRASRLRLTPSVATRAALASMLSPLNDLAAVLARNGQPGPAWQRFEEGLGRGLGDAWAVRSKRTSDEERRHTALLARLDHLDRRLQAVAAGPEPDRQRKDLLTQQRQALDALHALVEQFEHKYGLNEGRLVTLEQAQARLPADVALLGWVDMPGHPKAADPNGEHWAVVVRARDEPAWVRLPGAGPGSSWTQEDDRLPQQLVAALRQRPGAGAADAAALARRLARQRLEPLAAPLGAHGGLPAVRHLVVLPSEQMDGIPLEELSDRYTVSRAPSATFYTHLRGLPRSAGHGLVAVADPLFTRPQTAPPPLPPGGILLTVVVPGGNAAQAGLQPGDVLLRYAAAPLTRPADLKPRPDTGDPKAAITVEVWRDGRTVTRSVRLGKLGVLVADEPAPAALAGLGKLDRLLASRGPDGNDWPPLPGTRAEAEALRRLFEAKGAAVTLLTDADASEPRLAELARDGTLGRARYLHLATHGTFDPRFPLQSAVILAQHLPPGPAPFGRQYFDGELTAAEVLDNWKLDAELVTLSACETALGKQERGEGFLGFAQAALLAGARSVCLSLWKVDDTATVLLMERFYQNLLGQREGLEAPLGKAAALAEAKVWLRTLPRDEALKRAAALTQGVERGKGREGQPRLPEVPAPPAGAAPYAHPHYWAAFILVGDPD